MDYLVEHEGRNKFIKNLAKDLKGNTLNTIQLCRKTWVASLQLINSHTDKPVYFVHGGCRCQMTEKKFDG